MLRIHLLVIHSFLRTGKSRHMAYANRIRIALAATAVCGITACAPLAPHSIGESSQPTGTGSRGNDSQELLQLLNRLTWGANPGSAQQIATIGEERFLQQQLYPVPAS